MTAEPAILLGAPILGINEVELSRDEKAVSFQIGKIKCGSVWHEGRCSRAWIDKEKFELSQLDWRRLRHVVLTVDPGRFDNPQRAYEHFRKHRTVANLIYNLRRGKKIKSGTCWVEKHRPVVITNYRWYLEWYRSGYFHIHVLIEVDKQGRHGMIGQDMIHHYWNMGKIIFENPIKDQRHWMRLMGDFQKTGYLMIDKKHQGRLPDWALDIPGYKIRRSSGKRKARSDWRDPWDEYCKRACQEVVDPLTGEILANLKLPRERSNKSYRERHERCCQTVWAKITTKMSVIEGVFNIPWLEIFKTYKGNFLQGLGYIFHGSMVDVNNFLQQTKRIILIREFNQDPWDKELVGLERYKYHLKPYKEHTGVGGLVSNRVLKKGISPNERS